MNDAHRRWTTALVATTAILTIVMTGERSLAQIPQEVVERAVKGDVKPSLMLTACKQHTYKHRLRLENVRLQTEETTLTYMGKIVNVVRGDRNNLMEFKITIQGDSDPVIEFLKVEDREIGPKIKKQLKDIVVPLAEELIESQFALNQDARDRAQASSESRFVSMNQKDWKTPSLALVTAIAAKLYEMRH